MRHSVCILIQILFGDVRHGRHRCVGWLWLKKIYFKYSFVFEKDNKKYADAYFINYYVATYIHENYLLIIGINVRLTSSPIHAMLFCDEQKKSLQINRTIFPATIYMGLCCTYIRYIYIRFLMSRGECV